MITKKPTTLLSNQQFRTALSHVKPPHRLSVSSFVLMEFVLEIFLLITAFGQLSIKQSQLSKIKAKRRRPRSDDIRWIFQSTTGYETVSSTRSMLPAKTHALNLDHASINESSVRYIISYQQLQYECAT
ncbi:Hypothetical_protein [Hexamita inflata]|uniref:Hypothetical_protein n=1 Tax=Hexamita inflata TaxID=28002 RepID=A0AA86UGD8_9EUKA|nr:Hypothetical protein HINF_LOCUS37740 [Hexamita inflata]CAI9950097.1 Hypothetical protein HINF_LOCUS37742 [Hexamita inflata]